MKKSLAKTNPYLKNSSKCAALVRRSATTSTAIEGVHIKGYKPKLSKRVRRTSVKS